MRGINLIFDMIYKSNKVKKIWLLNSKNNHLSSIILLHKKDESIFCIDYKVLNYFLFIFIIYLLK